MKALKWGAAALGTIGLAATLAWVAPVGADPVEPPLDVDGTDATSIEEAFGRLDAEKQGDLGLPNGASIQVFNVEARTSSGNVFQEGRLRVEYPEAFDADVSQVVVNVALARNVEDTNNFPLTWQATEQSPTGFNLRLFNKSNLGIDGDLVRFQVTAIALP